MRTGFPVKTKTSIRAIYENWINFNQVDCCRIVCYDVVVMFLDNVIYLTGQPNRRHHQPGFYGRWYIMSVYEVISILLDLAMLVVAYWNIHIVIRLTHKNSRPDPSK
jgi:uncharacterized membrane protein